MKYTVKEEDTSLSANPMSTLLEVTTVLVIVILCSILARIGYGVYGVGIAVVTLAYYITVAYVKLMFSRLTVGSTYAVEKAKIGISVVVDKKTIIWIPVFIMPGADERLNLYSLTLIIKKEER